MKTCSLNDIAFETFQKSKNEYCLILQKEEDSEIVLEAKKLFANAGWLCCLSRPLFEKISSIIEIFATNHIVTKILDLVKKDCNELDEKLNELSDDSLGNWHYMTVILNANVIIKCIKLLEEGEKKEKVTEEIAKKVNDLKEKIKRKIRESIKNGNFQKKFQEWKDQLPDLIDRAGDEKAWVIEIQKEILMAQNENDFQPEMVINEDGLVFNFKPVMLNEECAVEEQNITKIDDHDYMIFEPQSGSIRENDDFMTVEKQSGSIAENDDFMTVEKQSGSIAENDDFMAVEKQSGSIGSNKDKLPKDCALPNSEILIHVAKKNGKCNLSFKKLPELYKDSCFFLKKPEKEYQCDAHRDMFSLRNVSSGNYEIIVENENGDLLEFPIKTIQIK